MDIVWINKLIYGLISGAGGTGSPGSDKSYWGSDCTLSLVGYITLACMGFWRVRYIGIDYRNRYCDPIKRRLLDSRSRAITTLILCIMQTKMMYKQCVDHKVTIGFTRVLT